MNIFKENEDKKYIEMFYILALECAINWGYQFPNVLDRNDEQIFKIRSEEIKHNQNIILPTKFIFFKNDMFFEEILEMKKQETNKKYGCL